MHILFKRIVLHNFLSFGDADIDLTDKGYCLIEGKNHNPSDRASSNGSGKSTIISAISWALTGQTIQGIKSNIENIHTTGGTFVKLYFKVDNDEFIIERYKNHEKYKTDLKIYKNDENISGKGIRESENILAQYLPDINFNMLSSVILLGQGLPNSFTKSTPSGRKELLEVLTKSDFMIQDVKSRIERRLGVLFNENRKIEDALLKLNTSKSIYNEQFEKDRELLQAYQTSKDFDTLLEANKKDIDTFTSIIADLEKNIESINKDVNNFSDSYSELKNEYYRKKEELNKKFNDTLLEISVNIRNYEYALNNKIKEIKNLEEITDICPTCGQKIPNVVKPDTTNAKKQRDALREELEAERDKESALDSVKKNETKELESYYNKELESLQSNLLQSKERVRQLNDELNNNRKLLNVREIEKSSLEQEKQNFLLNKEKLENAIEDLKDKLSKIEDDILYNTNDKDKLMSHIDIVNKMNTLVKRDFRGYLLKNIIDYIQRKAKEYCKYIFDSDDLIINLDGNDIDIVFCNKQFESLSGGEKQKIDVIIQFSIRDMMSNYLDFRTNVLFLDEITDNLDSKGCDGLINLISNTLNDLESIFIVSHHADELSLPVDTIITVEKDSNGISRVM